MPRSFSRRATFDPNSVALRISSCGRVLPASGVWSNDKAGEVMLLFPMAVSNISADHPRVLDDLLRNAACDHLPVVECQHPVAYPDDHIHMMLDQQNAHSPFGA